MPSSLSLADLIALSRNRWAVALLADVAAHNGARFVELLHRLDLSRDSLSRTLDAAKAAGWIVPNPGRGHPLRPEYLLTQDGARMALAVEQLGDAVIEREEESAVAEARIAQMGDALIQAQKECFST